MFGFQHPWLLLTLLVIPLVLIGRRRFARVDLLVVPYAAEWVGGGVRRKRWRDLAPLAALVLLALAAARPVLVLETAENYARGYDFMLAIDLSTSMLAEDYEVDGEPTNRLETLRPVLRSFISGRPDDRAGVVVFAGSAYTLAPLTFDGAWLDAQVEEISIGMIEDGTALGDGLGIALANLEDSRGDDSSEGAFVVLLTDGSNNMGMLEPREAALLARIRGIPVYTVGAGTFGMVPFPVFDDAGQRTGTRQRPSSFDEDTLQAVADETGGEYFRADDAVALNDAFAKIDQVEKAELSTRVRLRVVELFAWFVIAALGLLMLRLPSPHRALS